MEAQQPKMQQENLKERLGGKLDKKELEEIIHDIEEVAESWLEEPWKIFGVLPEGISLGDLKQQIISETWSIKKFTEKWNTLEERQQLTLANILGIYLSQAFVIFAEEKEKEKATIDKNITDIIEFICECTDIATKKGGFSYPAEYIAGRKFPESLVPVGNCTVLEALVKAKELLMDKKIYQEKGLEERIDNAVKKIINLLISDKLRRNDSYGHVYIPGYEDMHFSPDLWSTATVITILNYYYKIYKDYKVKEKINKTVKSIEERSISTLKKGRKKGYWRDIPKEIIEEIPEEMINATLSGLRLETESLRWKRVDEDGNRVPIIPLVAVAMIFLQGLDVIDDEKEKNEVISWLNMTLLRIIEKFEDLYYKAQQTEKAKEILKELVEGTPRFTVTEQAGKIEFQNIIALPIIVKFLLELYKRGVKEENEIVKRSLLRFPEYYPVIGICLRTLNVLFRERKDKGYVLFGYDIDKPADMGLTRLIYSLLKEYYSSFDDIERFFLREPGKFIEQWRYDIRFEINIKGMNPNPLEVERQLHAELLKEGLDKLEPEELESLIINVRDSIEHVVLKTDEISIESCIANFYDDRNNIKIPTIPRKSPSIKVASLVYSTGLHYIARGSYYRSGSFRGKEEEKERFEEKCRETEEENTVWESLFEKEKVLKKIEENSGRVIGILHLPKEALNIPWEAFPLGNEPLGIKIPIGRVLEVKVEAIGGRERDFILNILLIGDSGKRAAKKFAELNVKKEIDSIEDKIKDLGKRLEGYSIHVESYIDGDEKLSDILKERSWDILHFAGHADIAGEKVKWVIRDYKWDPDKQLEGIPAPRLVFANACGTAEVTDAQIMSQAEAFMRQGTSLFIGALAPVHDDDAIKFATEFYERLIGEKKPVGEALRGAREVLYKEKSPVWRLYVLYGDPRIRIIT
ncbi:MAG: hypothetical protein DSO07_08760 [Thermoproteota archaeon]|jgi:hypothetical protein|uniref:CHAT domain-containing protein n=1 Tax=Candidatus Methanodesulfokora washburnensis TaxID=2478471 RepID=A0A3R9RKC7_9CREN|nr:CHAT domain-containing protein [Candidatus Methanodesulfokores washburnensis]RSN71936.1 CHAT domain-containing protein [Candidatus Methanodesulfokores washburnensis]RZN60949.1 MAG: CHAT domain-containing protein [Candidatus Methanodesulfokores washburnensis]TDA40629.1 MAG: hypothetical protein DSO07_08760 [Candidatus Korarchaeota archaeon]